MLVTDLPQPLEVSLGSGDVTSLAENGFEYESGGVSRCSLLLEEEFETVEGLFDELIVRGRVRYSKLMPVRVRGSENTGLKEEQPNSNQLFANDLKDRLLTYHERSESFTVNSLGLGHGHGSESTTVVRSLNDDNVLLRSRMTSEFDSGFNCFSTRVPTISSKGSVSLLYESNGGPS